jgi:hypothetical protein
MVLDLLHSRARLPVYMYGFQCTTMPSLSIGSASIRICHLRAEAEQALWRHSISVSMSQRLVVPDRNAAIGSSRSWPCLDAFDRADSDPAGVCHAVQGGAWLCLGRQLFREKTLPGSQAPSSLDLIFKVPPTTSTPTTALLFACVTKDSLSNRRRLRSAPQWRGAWNLDGTAPSNQKMLNGPEFLGHRTCIQEHTRLGLPCHSPAR